MGMKLELDSAATALVLIDLQRGIVSRQTTPHSAVDVVARASSLVDAFRRTGALVVLVHVVFSRDDRDRLKPPVDAPTPLTLPIPPEFGELVAEVAPGEGDIVITKKQWGAFYGTGLDLQLRRRGIRTLVLGGTPPNFGNEATAPAAAT